MCKAYIYICAWVKLKNGYFIPSINLGWLEDLDVSLKLQSLMLNVPRETLENKRFISEHFARQEF